MGRHAVPGNRRRPDGFNLEWQQIGVRGMVADPQLPFVTSWQIDPSEHPSQMAPTELELTALEIAGDPQRVVRLAGRRRHHGAGVDQGRVGGPARHARHPGRHVLHTVRRRPHLSSAPPAGVPGRGRQGARIVVLDT